MNPSTTPAERFLVLQRTMRKVNNLAQICAGIFLLGMVLSISISVFARLLYTYTGIAVHATWAEELSRYLMVGSVFIGGAVAAYDLRLIGVDAFMTLAPPGLARWLRLTSHVLTLVFALLLVWKSARLVELGLRQWSPGMEIQMSYVYSLMFVGSVLMVVNMLVHVIGELLNSSVRPVVDAASLEAMPITQFSKETLS